MQAPTPIILDTFTDTNGTALTSHTGDSGNSWTAAGDNTGNTWQISNNSIAVSSINGGFLTGSLASTDLTAMTDLNAAASPLPAGPFICGGSSIGVGGNAYIATYYGNTYGGHTAGWYLFKNPGLNVIGWAAVGMEYPGGTTGADVPTVRVKRSTNAGVATVTVVVNGAQIISATDSSPLAQTGAGLFANNTGTGTLDNFRVFNASK